MFTKGGRSSMSLRLVQKCVAATSLALGMRSHDEEAIDQGHRRVVASISKPWNFATFATS